MPSDPSIYSLANQPSVPLLNPLDVRGKKNSLALQDQSLQSGALQLQQEQLAMRDNAARRAALTSFYGGAPAGAPAAGVPPTPPPATPGAGVDPLTGAALPAPPPTTGTAPPQAAAPPPTVPVRPPVPTMAYLIRQGVNPTDAAAMIQQFQKVDETSAAIDKTRADTNKLIAQQASDMANMLVKTATPGQPLNPQLVAWHLQHFASLGVQQAQQAQQVGQQLSQLSPADQITFMKTLAGTPETQNANAAEVTAAEKKQSSDRQMQDDADKRGLAMLGSTKADPKAYATVLNALGPAFLARNPGLDAAADWTPASAGKAQQMGLSSQEQITTAEAAKRDAQTAANENARLGVERARLAIEQNKAKGALGSLTPNDQVIAGKLATGEFNPALLSRMPNKEAIVAGAIALNPAWTPQVYEVNKSFKDGADSTAIGGMARVLGHLESYSKNSAALGFSPTALVGMSNGTAAQTRVARDASAISEEFGKLVKSNALTQTEADRYEAALTSSREGIRSAAVSEITDLMKAQFEAKYQKYKTATGNVLPADQFFDQHTMGLLRDKGALPEGYVEPGTAATAPAPASHGIPDLGSTFNGGKVLKVTRIQ